MKTPKVDLGISVEMEGEKEREELGDSEVTPGVQECPSTSRFRGGGWTATAPSPPPLTNSMRSDPGQPPPLNTKPQHNAPFPGPSPHPLWSSPKG